MFVLQYHFPLDSIMIPFFPSVSQVNQGASASQSALGQQSANPMTVNNDFLLDEVLGIPPGTPHPIMGRNGEVVESNDRPNQVSVCLCYNIIFHSIVS